nr:MAG TPA: hypothetical protein [Caudoviricetes sp.]
MQYNYLFFKTISIPRNKKDFSMSYILIFPF